MKLLVALCLLSEARRVASAEPVTVASLVVGDDADHFVQLGPNLHAACETATSSLRASRTVQGTSLHFGHRVRLIEERIAYNDMALSAANASTIVVVGHLIRRESVLLVATIAVGEDTGSSITLQDIEQTLARVSCISARDAIWRNHVDPDAV